MTTKYLSHDELQHIEHANKILEAHEELVKKVTNETEQMLNTYLPIVRGYVTTLFGIQKDFGEVVSNIVKSSREVSLVTSNTNNIENFCAAIIKLDALLTPEMIEKLNKIR